MLNTIAFALALYFSLMFLLSIMSNTICFVVFKRKPSNRSEIAQSIAFFGTIVLWSIYHYLSH